MQVSWEDTRLPQQPIAHTLNLLSSSIGSLNSNLHRWEVCMSTDSGAVARNTLGFQAEVKQPARVRWQEAAIKYLAEIWIWRVAIGPGNVGGELQG
jgi:hypothetical protein